MCPPVLIGALYALWADTQVRTYTNHINTNSLAIRRCNTSNGRTDRASLQPLHVSRPYVPIVTRQVSQPFQRWKLFFPTLEKEISTVGNFIFQAWKVSGKLTLWANSPPIAKN